MKGRPPYYNLLALIGAWIVLFAAFSLKLGGNFGSVGNLVVIVRQGAVVSVAALGMTYIIVSGGIDLSVGSTVAFVSVVIAWALQAHQTPIVAALLGICAGGMVGLINGTLITRLKVGPFIVTLGSLLIVRGIAKGLGHEQRIDAPLTWLNDLVSVLGDSQKWMVFPYGIWLMFGLAVLAAWALKSTRFGRHVIAVGSNEQAARLCGVPVQRVKTLVYMLGGLSAGVAGLLQFARLKVGDPTVAVGLELDVIAAVVIGGASLSGGEGTILGALLGALIMNTIRSGCSQMGLSNWIQEIVTGLIIVAAVAIDRFRARKA